MSESHETAVMRCWQCGDSILALRTQVGTSVECPHCKAIVTIPAELFGLPPMGRTISQEPERKNVSNKSPSTAGLLNFFFWGAGYVYAGKMWGWLILIPDILLSLAFLDPDVSKTINQEDMGRLIVFSLVIGLIFGLHAFFLVKEDRIRHQ